MAKLHQLQWQPLFLSATELSKPLPAWEYHLHTTFADGRDSVDDMAWYAWQKGVKRLIYTEHTEPELVRHPDWFRKYVEQIEHVQAQFKDRMSIAIGLEVPIIDYNGGLQITPEMLARVEFILGAVHAYPGYGWNDIDLDPNRAIELEYKGLLSLIENPLIDAIAHPGGVCTAYNARPFPMELFEDIVQKATANGIAIELNPAYQKPITPYLEICRRHNALISLGSNAHRSEALGWALQEVERLV
ncbi:MAG: PHP domain-containing protein [Magnetococcus sp. DMHC-6]